MDYPNHKEEGSYFKLQKNLNRADFIRKLSGTHRENTNDKGVNSPSHDNSELHPRKNNPRMYEPK